MPADMTTYPRLESTYLAKDGRRLFIRTRSDDQVFVCERYMVDMQGNRVADDASVRRTYQDDEVGVMSLDDFLELVGLRWDGERLIRRRR